MSRKWTPHAYQRKAIKFCLEHACAALWLDPGLGKTSISLGLFKVLKRQGLLRKMLVIAPLRPCYLVWPAEVNEWEDFNDLKMSVLHGKDKENALYSNADIYVINYEGLEWLFSRAEGSKKLRIDIAMDGDRGMLVVDEVTKLKHANTKRFKMVKPHLGRFGRRVTLTGTPAPNGYMDLFGQIYVADEGAALGRYITQFRNEFFFSTGFGGYTWELMPDGAERIQERLKPLVLRMDANDYLELPEIMTNPVYVELPAEARRVYNDLEEEMYTQLEDKKVVTALGAAAASIKCRQVASGGLYHNPIVTIGEDGLPHPKGKRTWADLHTAKIDAVAEIIESVQGRPVFITYDFEHDLARLRALLGADVPVLGGKGSGPAGIKYDKMLEAAWNRNELAFMLGHPASIGHGLNLQKSDCQDVILHSDTWDHELYDQLLRRFKRQGSRVSHIRAHHIIARDTVDEALYASHTTKEGLQRALTNSMKIRRLARRK